MALYCGIDLHARSMMVAIIDAKRALVYKEQLRNDPELLLQELAPYKEDLEGVALESTFNWYWLVDALMDDGYRLHLANTAKMQLYSGLKHRDDRHDARWLAEQLRLGILPEGFIYPKEDRVLRDLLRTRMYLVKQRTALQNRMSAILQRSGPTAGSLRDLAWSPENWPLEQDLPEDLWLNGAACLRVYKALTVQIEDIVRFVEQKLKDRPVLRYTQSISGVGRILAPTVVLETGNIRRFPRVGNYASYCRKVNTRWESQGRLKGRGNRKNGNKYLAWAFSVAAAHAKRHDPLVRAFFERKARRTNEAVAFNAVAHKLVRAAYYVQRDLVWYRSEKLFG
jgi:transposase